MNMLEPGRHQTCLSVADFKFDFQIWLLVIYAGPNISDPVGPFTDLFHESYI